MNDLWTMLEACTTVYRKGPVIETKTLPGVRVTEIWGYPSKPEDANADIQLVDMVFVWVGVNLAEAEKHRAQFERWCLDYRPEYPDSPRLIDGPSYIHMGAEVGDQEPALRVMALGSVLGYWTIGTMKTLVPDTSDEENRDMAGKGLLYALGYKEENGAPKRLEVS